MPYTLSKNLNGVEEFITSSKVISGILRNLIVATVVVVFINMAILMYMGIHSKSVCLSLLCTGLFMAVHHVSYKNYYKCSIGDEDNRNLIGNDV
jgi:hypothetical protein